MAPKKPISPTKSVSPKKSSAGSQDQLFGLTPAQARSILLYAALLDPQPPIPADKICQVVGVSKSACRASIWRGLRNIKAAIEKDKPHDGNTKDVGSDSASDDARLPARHRRRDTKDKDDHSDPPGSGSVVA